MFHQMAGSSVYRTDVNVGGREDIDSSLHTYCIDTGRSPGFPGGAKRQNSVKSEDPRENSGASLQRRWPRHQKAIYQHLKHALLGIDAYQPVNMDVEAAVTFKRLFPLEGLGEASKHVQVLFDDGIPITEHMNNRKHHVTSQPAQKT